MEFEANKRVMTKPIPSVWLDHDLIAETYFYTLPKELLDTVVGEVGRERFDQELLEMDESLSDAADGHTGFVGYFDGHAIFYPYLTDRTYERQMVSASDVEGLGWSQAQLDAVNSAGKTIRRDHEILAAYCGWLMCAPMFRSEHDELIESSQGYLHDGLPVLGQYTPEGQEKADPELTNVLDRWMDFYRRWQINKLVAPGLPDPPAPQWADLGQIFTPPHLRGSTTVLSIPNNHPVPSKDEVRQHVLQNRPDSDDSHLSDWQEIISPNNRSRGEIGSYARRFQLQHYWRVLFHRHSSALLRKKMRLEAVFAEYLGFEQSSVHKDLIKIRKSLGELWPDE